MLEEIYGRGAVPAQLTDAAWVRAMCDVEAALARALAALGEIPSGDAELIERVCAEPAAIEPSALGASLARDATPVIGLVAALRERLPESAHGSLHRGATSQDVVDTALMLLARRALDPLLADLAGAADAAARLADDHRDTPMIGRTLLQQALPTRFGLVAAGWLDGLTQCRGHLHHVRDAELAVQMGGPVGGRAPELGDRVAAVLGLAAPTIGWATIRVRPALTASVLGALAGTAGKIARDVTLLAQTEVGELTEARTGGSSAIAHKANPVTAVSALACAKRTPGLVATMLAAMEQEDQRAAGAWQGEWGTLTELLTLTGSATAWVRECLDGVQVDVARMADNLAASASAGEPPPPAAGELVDRALAAYRGAA